MSSVGIDLQQWVDAGLLQFQCFRPSLLGLEAHLFAMQKFVGEFDPAVVVMDPISDLLRIGTGADVSAMLTRQVDFLKAKGVTALFTSLNSDAELEPGRPADRRRSSTPGCWSRRWRATASTTACCTCSSRAGWPTPTRSASSCSPTRASSWPTSTSGPQGVLTGSARQAQEAKERSDGTARLEDLEQRRVNLERRRESVEAQTATLWREFEDEADIVRTPAEPRLDRTSRIEPASAPSRAGSAGPTPTSPSDVADARDRRRRAVPS